MMLHAYYDIVSNDELGRMDNVTRNLDDEKHVSLTSDSSTV